MAIRASARRVGVSKEQWQNIPAETPAPSLSHDAVDLASFTSSSCLSPPAVVPAGRGTPGWKEQVPEHSHPHQKPEVFQGDTSSIFENVPHRQTSKGNQKIANHLKKAKSCKKPHACKKSKSKISDDEVELYTPRFRIRGQSRGCVGIHDALMQQKQLDSKTFECMFEIIWGGFSEEKRSSFARLDCLWFLLYSQGFRKEKVLSWIKKENIFSKKYVMVPIVKWSHWSLLILCHFGESLESISRTPCMLLLDSMHKTGPKRLEPEIRKFIWDIYKSEDLPDCSEELARKIPLLVPKVPQQKDGEECGKYVLYYINLFLENAPDKFSVSEGYPYFMKEDWFTLEGFNDFCKRLVELVPERCLSSEE